VKTKVMSFSTIFFSVLMVTVFLLSGCASTSPLKNQPQHIMQNFKYYERIKVYASSFSGTKTNIIVRKNDMMIFMVSGSVNFSQNKEHLMGVAPRGCLFYNINGMSQGQTVFRWNIGIHEAKESGRLEFSIFESSVPGKQPNYMDNSGSFTIDVFVFEKYKEKAVPNLLNELALQNSEDEIFQSGVNGVNNEFKLMFAEKNTKQEILETKEEIQKISEKFQSVDEASISSSKNNFEVMKAKLEQLTEQLKQLDELKKEVEAKELREKDLLVKLEKSNQRPPIVFIGSPKSGLEAEFKNISLYGVVEDDKAIERVEFFVNGVLDEKISQRGIFLSSQEKPKRIEFNEKVVLRNGKNILLVKAMDSDGYVSEKAVAVSYTETRKNVWAVVIGINIYQNARHLKYAAKDAAAFYQYLIEKIRLPKENISYLINDQASLYEIRSVLGTYLRRKAGKDDMVMIYFAGHGATEEDSMSPDGDGLEKYILPYDADLKNLYASALPMSEIAQIFNRIYSERLIFIADACYSGASGGRTIGIRGMRANISDAFLNRISKGRGRVIITASGANEVSAEKDDLGHGVFTYYLLEGLKGKADLDKDGMITVDEIYNYVSINVPNATGQSQHPVKKGSVEGQLIMGVVE